MDDIGSSRLALLRFLERVQERDLLRTRRWIADEERREAEWRVGKARRRPTPEWLIERGLDRNNIVALHTGQCWDPGKRTKPVTREQPIEALRQRVPACVRRYATESSPLGPFPMRALAVVSGAFALVAEPALGDFGFAAIATIRRRALGAFRLHADAAHSGIDHRRRFNVFRPLAQNESVVCQRAEMDPLRRQHVTVHAGSTRVLVAALLHPTPEFIRVKRVEGIYPHGCAGPQHLLPCTARRVWDFDFGPVSFIVRHGVFTTLSCSPRACHALDVLYLPGGQPQHTGVRDDVADTVDWLHMLLGHLLLIRGRKIGDEPFADALFEASPEDSARLGEFITAFTMVDGRAECRVWYPAVRLSSIAGQRDAS